MMSMEEQREMDRLKAVIEGLRRQVSALEFKEMKSKETFNTAVQRIYQLESDLKEKKRTIVLLKNERWELHVKIEQLSQQLIEK